MKYYISNEQPVSLEKQLRKIACECSGKKDVTIEFERNQYNFIDLLAIEEFKLLMSGALNYDTHWGKGDISYHKGVVFKGIQNLTIIGNQSTIVFEGLIAPFTFLNCRNVYFEGLTIDWARPLFSIGKIMDIKNDTVKIKPHPNFEINGGEPIWALMDYETPMKRFGQAWQFRNMSSIRKITESLFEFDTKVAGELIVGYDIVLRHVGNYRPCIHILESENLYFRDLTIHHNPGMGVVGHYSKDITFRNLKVMPKRDHIMSTTTDATHFINCEGLIDFENCYFEGMGDDAINVHGFYNTITKVIDDHTLEVTIKNSNGTQDQVFDLPRIGDEVEFSKVLDLSPFGVNNTVVDYNMNEKDWTATLSFRHAISTGISVGDLLCKTNDVAGLRFVNCHIKSIRARACLIQTRNVLIESCLIENCTGTGIHVNTATGWWESVRCENVCIRHNTIRNCGYGDGTYHNTSGIVIMTETEGNAIGIHKNIVLENNIIYGNLNTGITVLNTDGCQIINNKIVNCETAMDIAVSDHILLLNNETPSQNINFRRNV